MTIVVLARRTGVPVDSLRFWEKKGLLTPARRTNGYRWYTEEDLARVDFIGSAKGAGFTLAEIGQWIDQIFNQGLTFADLANSLRVQRERIDQKIADLQAFGNRVDRILSGCLEKGPIRDVLIPNVQGTNDLFLGLAADTGGPYPRGEGIKDER